jgi:hypothetical protein
LKTRWEGLGFQASNEKEGQSRGNKERLRRVMLNGFGEYKDYKAKDPYRKEHLKPEVAVWLKTCNSSPFGLDSRLGLKD